jgi:hypothetical protein
VADDAGKEKSMKNIITKPGVAIAAVFVILATAVPAYTNENWMRVDIPFSFFAGEQKLPAGEYRVRFDGAFRLLDLMSQKETTICRVRVRHGLAKRKPADAGKGVLSFHRYGGDYVLKRVFFRDETESHDLGPSKAEVESARTAALMVGSGATFEQLSK